MDLYEGNLNSHGTDTGLSSYSRHISVISYAWTCYICSCARVFSCGFLIAVFLSQLHFYTIFYAFYIPQSYMQPSVYHLSVNNEWMNTASYRHMELYRSQVNETKATCIYKIKSVTTTCYAYRRTLSSTIKRKLTATKQAGWPATQITNTITKATGHKCGNDAQVK